VKILENGWSVEMKIPYFEMRFPKSEDNNGELIFSDKLIDCKPLIHGIM
jgi:hypothetical protein